MIRTLILSILIFTNVVRLISQKISKPEIGELKSYFLDSYFMRDFFKTKSYDSALAYFNKIETSPFVTGEDYIFGTIIYYRKANLSKANKRLKAAIKLNYSVEDTIYLRNWTKLYPKLNQKVVAGLFINYRKFCRKDSLLRTELVIRNEKDQLYRQNVGQNSDSIANLLQLIDLDNQRWLDSIIELQGWPLKSNVGAEGANGAWIIAQHADNDTSFQLRCLVGMIRAYKLGDVIKSNLAYLIDRYFINTQYIQIFGSQFIIDHHDSASIKLKPVIDFKHLDNLRSVVQLPSVEDYLKHALERLK